jgi:hypothetical protein
MHGDGGLLGLTVAVREPARVAQLWARLLGVDADGTQLRLDGGRQRIDFIDAADKVERIVAVRVSSTAPAGETVVAGVRFGCEAIHVKETR